MRPGKTDVVCRIFKRYLPTVFGMSAVRIGRFVEIVFGVSSLKTSSSRTHRGLSNVLPWMVRISLLWSRWTPLPDGQSKFHKLLKIKYSSISSQRWLCTATNVRVRSEQKILYLNTHIYYDFCCRFVYDFCIILYTEYIVYICTSITHALRRSCCRPLTSVRVDKKIVLHNDYTYSYMMLCKKPRQRWTCKFPTVGASNKSRRRNIIVNAFAEMCRQTHCINFFFFCTSVVLSSFLKAHETIRTPSSRSPPDQVPRVEYVYHYA
jgi:hypothetical protein